MQHLAHGFDAVRDAINTMAKRIDAWLPVLFRGACAQPRTIFLSRDLSSSPIQNRAAAFRAINVSPHNLCLTVTERAYGRGKTDFVREISSSPCRARVAVCMRASPRSRDR
jgi:hypothetical protein